MIQTAGGARDHLGDSLHAVRDFLRSRQDAIGAFHDRHDRPDVYYTVFGIEAAQVANLPLDADQIEQFLAILENGANLDFIHTAALARCWADIDRTPEPAWVEGMLGRIERHRSRDGGYGDRPEAPVGSAYHNFLAVCAYQDLARNLPDPQGIVDSLALLERADGGYVTEPDAAHPSVPATAAAVVTLRSLGRDVRDRTIAWLLGQCKAIGGFPAAPLAPVQDLLSTATALFALTQAGADIDPIRQRCLEFVESLWDTGGGFCGNWLDETVDCEYTYYGLLALGCL